MTTTKATTRRSCDSPMPGLPLRANGTALLLFLSVALPAPGTAQAPPPDLAITHVEVVDVEAGTILPDRTVLVENGTIRAIRAGSAPIPDGFDRIDARGKYLMPGLWDMHVHLRSPLAPTVLMPQFVANGVTGVREMASGCEEADPDQVCAARMREWHAQVEKGEMIGPRLMALSSFPLNPPWDYEVTEDEVRGLVREIATRDVDFIKVYYRLTPDALRWIIDEADAQGLRVGGHLPLGMTTREASEAGLRSLEHARDLLFDCFPGSADLRSTARSQNPPMDVMRSMVDDHQTERCAETFAVMVRNDTWYVPTHVTRRMDAFADDLDFRNDPRERYIPAGAWKSWQADADRMVELDPSPEGRRIMRGFYEKGLEITGRAHAAGVPIALGTDAGDTYVFPGSGAHDELGELVKAGLTPAEALAAGTIRAAEFLGEEDGYGTVEVGKAADLVLLEADPLADIDHVRRIDAVILGGRMYDREALDAMLEGVVQALAELDGRR